MSNKTADMDLEELLAQRNKTLESALKDEETGVGESDNELLEAAEINYITNFFQENRAGSLSERLTQLRTLMQSREFKTPQGKEALQKEIKKVATAYQSAEERANESTSKFTLLRLVFFLLGIVILPCAVFLFLGGAHILGIVLGVVAFYLLGKGGEYKEEIQEIQDAQKQILASQSIAKLENQSIVF